MSIGIFSVSSYPVVEDVYDVLCFIPKDAHIVTGKQSGVESRIRGWAFRNRVKLDRVVPVWHNVTGHKKCKFNDVSFPVFDKFTFTAMIFFWSARYKSVNLKETYWLILEAKRRKIPVKIIRPSGLWTETTCEDCHEK